MVMVKTEEREVTRTSIRWGISAIKSCGIANIFIVQMWGCIRGRMIRAYATKKVLGRVARTF